jgi:hypothetical protein
MMFDMNMLLSHKQVLAASGDSANGYDRLLNGDDIHRVMSLVVYLNSVSGSGSITVKLMHSADGEAWTEAWSSGTKTAAVGELVKAPLPTGLKRFLKLNYTLASTLTGVTVTGGITDNDEVPCAYENVQKRDKATKEIPDLAAQTDALNAAAAAEPSAAAEE